MRHLASTFIMEPREGYNECPCEYEADWTEGRFSDEPPLSVDSCRLSCVYFGGARLDRALVVQIVGEEAVARQEAMFRDLDLPHLTREWAA
jgi:hypothetical protein